MILKVGLAAALLFGTGVVTGWGVGRFSRSAPTPMALSVEAPADPAPLGPVTNPISPPNVRIRGLRLPAVRPPGAGRFEQFKRALGEMELEGEQRTRIESLFRESQERLKALLKPLQPDALRELRVLRQQVIGELTREQRVQFERQLTDRPRPRPAEPTR